MDSNSFLILNCGVLLRKSSSHVDVIYISEFFSKLYFKLFHAISAANGLKFDSLDFLVTGKSFAGCTSYLVVM